MFGKIFADKRYVLQDLPRNGVIDDVKNAICVFVKDYEHSISWDCTNLLHYALSNNSDTKVAKLTKSKEFGYFLSYNSTL